MHVAEAIEAVGFLRIATVEQLQLEHTQTHTHTFTFTVSLVRLRLEDNDV